MKTLRLIILSIIIGFLFNFEVASKNVIAHSYFQCKDTVITYKPDSLTELILKTISITKPRNFLWFRLNHNRLIVKDAIYDGKGLIIEATSKFICSMDACETIRFNRFIIKNGKIIKFKYSDKTNTGLRQEYNLSGRLIISIRTRKDLLLKEYIVK
jgi:hypothetical protein